jgi:H+-transporting ATPase
MAGKNLEGIGPQDSAVLGSILPECKYDLVKAFQKGGHSVGMSGDRVDDTTSLHQEQIGNADSTAIWRPI